MKDGDIREAFRVLTAGTDPQRTADAVRKAVASRKGTAAKNGKENFMKAGKRKWTAVLAAAALVTVLGAAVAAAPILRNYLNARALQEDSAGPLTEVPDGWTGVYTTDDLSAVREDLSGYYILMEDLRFDPEDFEAGGRFEGGWEPIGTYTAPFTGVFNGNGHTVSGLVIETATDSELLRSGNARMYYAPDAVGLFGYVRSAEEYILHEYEVPVFRTEYVPDGSGTAERILTDTGETTTEVGMTVDASRWGRGGTVKNLRLKDGVLRMTYQPAVLLPYTGDDGEVRFAPETFPAAVGPVAGYADYVLGCSVENFRVEVRAAGEEAAAAWEAREGRSLGEESRYRLYLNVGGVTGGCYLADCCSSDAEITVRAGAGYAIPNPSVGGISGVMSACVTSYFDGSIDSDAGDRGVGAVREDDVPRVLTKDVLFEIAARLVGTDLAPDENGVLGPVYAENYEELVKSARAAASDFLSLNEWAADIRERTGRDPGWHMNKFLSFYIVGSPAENTEITQDFYTGDAGEETFYLLDTDLKPREYAELSKLIALAFPGNSFGDFCRENGVKYGCYYAYDLRADPGCAFEGFDFDSIWSREDRLPVLRLFR